MVAIQPPTAPPITHWFDTRTGQPTTEFLLYMAALDAVLRLAIASLQATATEVDLGTPANGATITPNPSSGSKQAITNNVAAFNIDATAEVGDTELRIVNGATAGTPTFVGFDKQFAGDALTTTVGDQFAVFIYGWGAKKAYLIRALQ